MRRPALPAQLSAAESAIQRIAQQALGNGYRFAIRVRLMRCISCAGFPQAQARVTAVIWSQDSESSL
jgi:hypothetical protein